MKKKPILIILLVVLSVGLYYFNNQKPLEKEIKNEKLTGKIKNHNYLIVSNQFIDSIKEITGIICLPKKDIKTSNMYGEIDYIATSDFKQGEVILRYKNTELFEKLASTKKTFKERLSDYLNELNGKSREIWGRFYSQVLPEKVLPLLPEEISPEEIKLLKKHNCIYLYNHLVDLEYEMENFFIIADFNGKIEECPLKIGDKIDIGDTLFTLIKKEPLIIKINTILNHDLDILNSVNVLNSFNKKIGSCSYFNKNNKYTYFKFNSFDNKDTNFGEKVVLQFKVNGTIPTFKLPKNFLRIDSTLILANHKKRKLNVIKKEKDYFIVSGLIDGDSILLEKTN